MSDYNSDRKIKKYCLDDDQDQVLDLGSGRGRGGSGGAPGPAAPGPDRSALGSYSISSKLCWDYRRWPWLKPYQKDVRDFVFYLQHIKNIRFCLEGFDSQGEWITRTFEYPCRWHEARRKATLAKLYLLDEWWKASGLPVTMMTLTTYHDWQKPHHGQPSRKVRDGYSIEKSFALLNRGWERLHMVMNYYLGTFDYLWVLEPHQTGYPHYHVLVFDEISDSLQVKIRSTWAEKYGIAGRHQGVNFSARPVEGLQSARNYMMKYLEKSFSIQGLTPCQLTYHALLWKNRYRMWGSSQNLNQVMKYRRGENGVTWTSLDLQDQEGELHEMWRLKPVSTP